MAGEFKIPEDTRQWLEVNGYLHHEFSPDGSFVISRTNPKLVDNKQNADYGKEQTQYIVLNLLQYRYDGRIKH